MAEEPVVTQEPIPSRYDRLPNRVIVLGLVLVLLMVVTWLGLLPLLGKEAPDSLSQIAMPIITGVAGFYTGQAMAQKGK